MTKVRSSSCSPSDGVLVEIGLSMSQALFANPPQFEGQMHLSPTTMNARGDFLATGTLHAKSNPLLDQLVLLNFSGMQ